MTRPSKETYDLSHAEKRDLIALIQQGKPLPEKYRFILFEDKREVELVWNGKTRDVCTTILPFQTLEHIDEPRTETKRQEELFDPRGRQVRGWTNKLIWGDNKLILSSLKSGALRLQIEDAGGLKLIYIDPPFDVGADFSMDIEIGGETFHKEPNLLEQIAYRDTWGRGADSFIAMIYERLTLMRDLLAEDGSIYVRLEPDVGNMIRVALDEVFGRNCLRTEIAWKRTSSHGNVSRSFGEIWESIYFYSRSPERWTWNQQHVAFEKEYIESHFTGRETDGRIFTPSSSSGRSTCRSGGCSSKRGSPNAASAARLGSMCSRSSSRWACSRRRWKKHVARASTWRPRPSRRSCSTSAPSRKGRCSSSTSPTSKRSPLCTGPWQSFRTRQSRELELTTAEHTYAQPGRYTVAVKVIDIFGNDTMTLVPVKVG